MANLKYTYTYEIVCMHTYTLTQAVPKESCPNDARTAILSVNVQHLTMSATTKRTGINLTQLRSNVAGEINF